MSEEKNKAPAKKATAAKKPAAKKTVESSSAPASQKASAPKKAAAPVKAKKPAGKTLTVRQVASPIGRPDVQTATLKGLGLNKLHRTRVLEDTPAVRGMIRSIPHLVQIVEDAA